METVKVQVRCQNRYFKGEVEGVKFTPKTGGAVGMATPAQARKIAAKKGFSCPDLVAASDEPEGPATPAGHAITEVDGIGKKTASKLAEAGVSTLNDLVHADVAKVAEAVKVSEEAVKGWQAEAAERLK